MKVFFEVSWIILLVTVLVLIAGNMLEKRSQFVTKYLKMEIKSFNLVFGSAGLLISLVNYFAVQYFGSWKNMIISVAIFAVALYIIIYLFKRNKSKD